MNNKVYYNKPIKNNNTRCSIPFNEKSQAITSEEFETILHKKCFGIFCKKGSHQLPAVPVSSSPFSGLSLPKLFLSANH